MHGDGVFGGEQAARTGLDALADLPPNRKKSVRPLAAGAVAARTPMVWPVATCSLVGLIVVVFMLQQAVALGLPFPSYALNHRSLLSLGGDSLSLLQQGQWWRVITGPLLQPNFGHLILDAFCLALAGRAFEPAAGWGWFLATFLLSQSAGGFATVLIQDPATMSVGASGGVMGVLAAMLVCSSFSASRRQMRTLALWLLLPALTAFAADAIATLSIFDTYSFDCGSYAGGALAGAAMGVVMGNLWPQGEARPLLRPAAGALAMAGLALVAVAIVPAVLAYPAYRAASQSLAPDDAFPSKKAFLDTIAPAVVRLEATYPQDPRTHLWAAERNEFEERYGEAEAELRAALAPTAQLDELPPDFARLARARLALTVWNEGRRDDARALAQPLCHDSDASWAATIAQTGLCGPS